MVTDGRKPGGPQNLGRAKLTWLKRVALHRGLSHFNVHVALVLANYVNNKTGETFVSQTTLATKTRASRRGVQGALDALVAAGFLRKRHEGHGPKTPNNYQLTLPPASAGPQKVAAKVQPAHHPAGYDEPPDIPF